MSIDCDYEVQQNLVSLHAFAWYRLWLWSTTKYSLITRFYLDILLSKYGKDTGCTLDVKSHAQLWMNNST